MTRLEYLLRAVRRTKARKIIMHNWHTCVAQVALECTELRDMGLLFVYTDEIDEDTLTKKNGEPFFDDGFIHLGFKALEEFFGLEPWESWLIFAAASYRDGKKDLSGIALKRNVCIRLCDAIRRRRFIPW